MGLGGEGWGSDQSETQGTVRGPWLGSETLAGLRDVALTRVRMRLGGEGWGSDQSETQGTVRGPKIVNVVAESLPVMRTSMSSGSCALAVEI